MKWGWVGAALFLIFSLVACAEGQEAVVDSTAVPTPPPTLEPTVTETAVPEMTETPSPLPPTPTPVSTATRTLTAEPTPSPMPPLPGMVFVTSDEALWWIDASSQPERLFEKRGILEPGGRRLLFTQDFDVWMVDLATGSQQNVTNTPDIYECCAQWWPNHPDQILLAQYDPVREYELGQMVVVTLEGERRILAEEYTDTLPAISSDGQTIAFDIGAFPALYHANGEIEQLDFFQPVDSLIGYRVGLPAWSPDGKELAWTAYFSDSEGEVLIACLIYQIETAEVDLLHLYYPGGHDSWGPKPTWHPDGTFVTLFSIDKIESERGLWVLAQDGSHEWNLGNARTPVWSPDGRFLVYHIDGVTYLTTPEDFTKRVRVDLPVGAQVIGWQEIP